MRLGRASHLYLGAIIRGRSVRREVGLGVEEKVKGSFGHAAATSPGLNVGGEKAAVFVCRVGYEKIGYQNRHYDRRTVEGYKGFINSESVAVGNMPTAFLALTAELAAAGLPPDEPEPPPDLE